MPINITPLYTGRDSAAAFPDLDRLDDSLRRKQDITLRGEEIRLDKTLKDRDAFMKLMEVDPVMAVSLRGQEQQAKDLEAYNNKGAEIMRRSGGRPSEADRMEMLREKALLQAKQNKILGNQKMWEEAKQTISRDTRGYYDRRTFEEAEQRYFQTGEFTPDALQVAPQDITGLLSMDKPQSAYLDDKGKVVKDERGNVLGYSSMEFKRTREEAQEQIFSKLQSEPVLKFVIREFEKAPEEEQMKYLRDYDSNKNGKIDPDEQQYVYQNMDIRSNPIVQWAMNNERYIATSMGGNPSVPKNVPGQSRTTFDWNIAVGGGHNRNNEFQEQKDVYGYKRFLNLGRVSFTSDPQMIGEYYDINTKTTKSLNAATRFEVVGYSPDKDVIRVKITDDARDDKGNRVRQGQQIELSASRFDDLLKSKPFGIDRSSLLGTQATAQATQTPIKKKLY